MVIFNHLSATGNMFLQSRSDEQLHDNTDFVTAINNIWLTLFQQELKEKSLPKCLRV